MANPKVAKASPGSLRSRQDKNQNRFLFTERIDIMTREQAYKIAKAVDDIEAFECFADMIEGTINQGIDICGISEDDDFIIKLRKLIDNELDFRKKVLEAM